MEKSISAHVLMTDLYRERYTQTLWNTEDIEKQKNGWVLKNEIWSPWFFNMRPVGSSPMLFYTCCAMMAKLISVYEVDMLIAVDMAGINLSGGMAVASYLNEKIARPIGYTRPLPKKVRTPVEAMQLLRSIETDVAGYGQKEFVEARLYDGQKIAIFDDMSTNLGSKIIARLIVLWMAEQKGISVECNKIFYILNRSKGNRQAGLDFAHEPEQGLYPASLEVNYVLEFDDYLSSLQPFMKEPEFEVISEFQKSSNHFQDKDVQKDVLALADRSRGGA